MATALVESYWGPSTQLSVSEEEGEAERDEEEEEKLKKFPNRLSFQPHYSVHLPELIDGELWKVISSQEDFASPPNAETKGERTTAAG